MNPHDRAQRVTFDLNDRGRTESVWAEPGPSGGYILLNTPMFAFGYSRGDLVAATQRDGRLLVTSTMKMGGHSTYRLIINEGVDDSDFADAWDRLVGLGVQHERFGRIVALDVPPDANIHSVYSALDRAQTEGIWVFEEAHVGHAISP